MSEYEITYLSSPQLSDEARSELDAAVDAAVATQEGTITHSEPTMRRRLFFPIKKQIVAFARAINVSLAPEKLTAVKDALAKNPGILRVTILKTPQRDSLTPAIFESLAKPAVVPKAKAGERAGAKRAVTMAEVEEKIEKALEEEVK